MAGIGSFIELALYQPDIPQNAGAMLRLGACFAVPVHIIEPCGFVFSDSRMRRAGMDYIDQVAITRHDGWDAFCANRRAAGARIVLMTTKGEKPYSDFNFRPGDTILMGRESAGVPDDVHAAAAARLVIPMAPDARSLNVAQAAAIVVSEAMRQLPRVTA